MKLKTRMECNRLARQSFRMLKIHKNRALFLALFVEEEGEKKEDEQNRKFQVWFFRTC